MKVKIKIRIAIYSRKSKYSDKGDSVGNQIELALEYIKMHYPEEEYEVEIEIFEDEGFSGGTIDRPEFQRMLKMEEEKPFNVLIVYRLDRISRNIADFSNLMNELTKLNTSFVSIKEQFDTKTPMGRAMMFIASVFAQLEREVIAERVRDNMIELAKTGRWLGGQTPTGFDSERYEIVNIYEKNNDNTLEKKKKKACKLIENVEERKIIEIIAQKYLEIKSLTGLEYYLIKHDIKSRKGAYFSTSRLRVILTNLVYVSYDQDIKEYLEKKNIRIFTEPDREIPDGKYGLISYNKVDGNKNAREMDEWIVAVGLHPGYIKGIDFIRIQELLEKNSSKRYRSKCKNEALLSGIIKCENCGSYMRPKATGNRRGDNGKRRYYYTCEKKDKSKGLKCHSSNVAGIALDNLIIERLKEILVPSSEIYKELKAMSISRNTVSDNIAEIESLKKTYNKNKEAIKKLIEKLKYIDIDVIDLINEELKKLKDENQSIQVKIQKLEKEKEKENVEKTQESKGAKLILDIIDNCIDRFDELDLKLRKDILRIFINELWGNGENVRGKILNTKLEESQKKLFSNMVEEDGIKNNSKNNFQDQKNSCVAIRTGKHVHQCSDNEYAYVSSSEHGSSSKCNNE